MELDEIKSNFALDSITLWCIAWDILTPQKPSVILESGKVLVSHCRPLVMTTEAEDSKHSVILFLINACFSLVTEHIPSLSHLCRLKIRSLLTSVCLQSDQHIHQMPIPTCLQDFLLYLDVLRTYSISESWLKVGEIYEESTLPSSSNSKHKEEKK